VASIETSTNAAITQKPRPSILLIDDDPAVRESLGRVLATEPWDVITADGGESAMLHLQEHVPDLIITDLCMQSLNGWDLLFHHRLEYPRLPIFVVSALAPHATGGAEKFATEFFQKPVDIDALLKAIRRRLSS